MRNTLIGLLLLFSSIPLLFANTISLEQVTLDMKFLASDSLKGRGNFSPELNKAADYIAKRFEQIGLQPFAGNSFLQPFTVYKLMPAQLDVKINQQVISLNKMAFVSHQALWQVDNLTNISIHYITEADNFRSKLLQLNQQGGQHLVIVSEKHEAIFSRFQQYFSHGLIKSQLDPDSSLLVVMSDDFLSVQSINIKANTSITAFNINNVVGVLPAAMQLLQPHEQVVFSAHYDHLGEHANSTTDTIYNGADDDASGTTAVINLAQYYKNKGGNTRDLIFVAFAAEEVGGAGSAYFSQHINPDQVIAMINIEMIGKPSKFGQGTVWMTGAEYSSLQQIMNSALTDSQIYTDPYPEQQLFYRSDNATLARLGVPAHSFSSTQLDKDQFYHQPTDELSTLDLDSMTQVIKTLASASEPLALGTKTPTRIKHSEIRQKGKIF
jgi:hypothetical protein